MNWEKGTFRAVLVLSIAVFPFVFVFFFKHIYDDRIAFAVSLIAFAGIWIGYYAVLWIIKGFRDQNKK